MAVCLTAKVANSAISDYIRWTRIGPPEVCMWTSVDAGKSSARGEKDACDLVCKSARCDRLRRPERPPLHACKYLRGGNLTATPACALLRAPVRLIVPVRDPYQKLVSAFSKYGRYSSYVSGNLTLIAKQDVAFKHTWLPSFSRNISRPPFIRYLNAITTLDPRKNLNYHFQTQAEQCLAPAMVMMARDRSIARLPVVIDRPHLASAGLDALSEHFGSPAGSNRSFSAVMRTAYSAHSSRHEDATCWESDACADVDRCAHTKLMRRIARFLAPSYAALREQFGVVYASETAILRAGSSQRVQLCVHSRQILARNATDAGWSTLL